MSGSSSNRPSEPVRLRRAFIYDEHRGYFSAVLIDSRRSIRIKNRYDGQVGVGCFIRMVLSDSADNHTIKAADSGDLKSHMNDSTERVFEAEGFFTRDNPAIIFQEDFGQLPVEMPCNLARQDGDKAIAIRIEEVGDLCEINTQPLIECEGLVVTNAIVRGTPTSYIFTYGCRSYSDVYFVGDSMENLPPVGSFVRFLIQYNYYLERARRPTQITRLLDSNCRPPMGVCVGSMRQQQNSSEASVQGISPVSVMNFQTDFKSADGEFEHDFFGQIVDKKNLIYPNVLYRELVLRKIGSKKNVTPWTVERAEPAYS